MTINCRRAFREIATTRILDRARILGGLLRVGYILSASMPGVLPRAPLHVSHGKLLLDVPRDLEGLAGDRLHNPNEGARPSDWARALCAYCRPEPGGRRVGPRVTRAGALSHKGRDLALLDSQAQPALLQRQCLLAKQLPSPAMQGRNVRFVIVVRDEVEFIGRRNPPWPLRPGFPPPS